MRDQLEIARDRLERLRFELATARKVLGGPPGRDLQVRPARRADRRARVRRLRRAARARRVPRPNLRLRTARSPSACAACATALMPRPPNSRGWSARCSSRPSRSCARRDQIAATKNQLVTRPGRARASARQRPTGHARPSARQSPAPGGRPGRARAPAGAHPGPALGRGRDRLRRADQARLGPADLAGQRADRVALRHALGSSARRRRHRGAGRHADPRRRLGPRGADGLGRTATATTPASSTPAASPPATPTSRASAPPTGPASARAR